MIKLVSELLLKKQELINRMDRKRLPRRMTLFKKKLRMRKKLIRESRMVKKIKKLKNKRHQLLIHHLLQLFPLKMLKNKATKRILQNSPSQKLHVPLLQTTVLNRLQSKTRLNCSKSKQKNRSSKLLHLSRRYLNKKIQQSKNLRQFKLLYLSLQNLMLNKNNLQIRLYNRLFNHLSLYLKWSQSLQRQVNSKQLPFGKILFLLLNHSHS